MTGLPTDFEAAQRRATRVLCTLAWVHVPVTAWVAWMAGNSLAMTLPVSLLLPLIAELMLLGSPQKGRIAVAIALTGQVAVLTAALAGSPWQVDSHMYFFAILASLSFCADVAAILAAAALVAVHHLTLNFLMPELVYPGGGSLGRTVMHAVILLVETVFLAVAVQNRLTLQKVMAAAFAKAEATVEESRRTQEDAARVEAGFRETQARMLDLLESEFQVMIDNGNRGDFSARITRDFDSAVFTALAERLNSLFETLDRVCSGIDAQLAAVAAGDLTEVRHEELPGRFGDIRQKLHGAVFALRGLVEGIGTAVGTTNTALDALIADSADLSLRSAAQASSIEETSAAMEELSRTVQDNSNRLSEADALAEDLARKTLEGSETVRRGVDAMKKIEDSSQKINEIISVIDSIAFQTNLLALNAAVEAARAGDAGKGFAVVASEVRSLAQRSSGAARDISALIRESTANVDGGVRLVQETGAALEDITVSLQSLTATISAVANAGRAQSEGILEVKVAVRQMDDSTQSNAALSDRTVGAAQGLLGNFSTLSDLIGRFRVTDPVTRVSPVRKGSAQSITHLPARIGKPGVSRGPPVAAPRRAAAAGQNAARPLSGAEDWSQF